MKAGDVIAGRYRLVERLGGGGMGDVWRAEQVALDREVALKVVRSDFGDPREEARERFRREAALAAKVEHRNVVHILDYGTDEDGTQYLVMPLLRGQSLQTRLQDRAAPVGVGELLRWLRGILSGLAAIHDRDIVHRDLKPANVFLARDDDGVIPKLLDFGISRPATAGATMTGPGASVGTPQYMAPEQFEAASKVDSRADVWGAGAILYEALTGRRPYEGDDAFGVYKQVLDHRPTPVGQIREDLPAGLVALVDRALAQAPDSRFADGREMRDALDALLASGELDDAFLEGSVVDGARVPRTASMEDGDAAPVSGDAPTELAPGSEPAAGGTVALDRPASDRKPPWALIGIGLAVVAIALLSWDLVRRGRPDEVAAPEPPDAGAPPVVATAPDAGPPAASWVVSAPETVTELAARWARLAVAVRDTPVRFVERGGRWVAIVPGDASAEARAGLAEAFGAEPEPSDSGFDDGLTPRLVRTTVRLSVRAAPSLDATVDRILPHHGVAVALDGAPASDDAMQYVTTAVGSVGWVVRRFLEPHPGCLPATDAVAARAADAAPRATLDAIRGGTWVDTFAHLDGRRQRVLLLATIDLGARRSDVHVLRLSHECGLEPIAAHALDGVIDEWFLTETLGDGGRTMLAVAVTPDGGGGGMRDWTLRPLEGGDVVWRERLPTAQALPDAARVGVTGTRDRIARGRRDPFVLSVGGGPEPRRWLIWADGAVVAQNEPAD